MKSYFLFFLSFIILPIYAQDVPTPALPQSNKICLKGGMVHIGNGQVLENGWVCFENGKLTLVASVTTIKTDETQGQVIDVVGKHIYPGLISLNTTLGITEIDAVRATNDMNESGTFNPNARTAIAYNTDSRVSPTVRSNGVLYAQVAPRGGRIAGSSSLVQLDAWNWEDALVKSDEGVFLNWPAMYNQKGWWAEPGGTEANKNYAKEVEELNDYFLDAKSYHYANPDKKNLRFEAVRALFDKKAKLYVSVDFVLEIKQAIQFAEEIGVELVIVGGSDTYQIADEIAKKKIAVVVEPPHSLPKTADGDLQQPYKTPAILQKAGVLFAISIGSSWQERNLPFQAGTAVAFGLSKEEALASITLNPAKIMGIDTKIGSITEGKSATLVICSGDILDMKSSTVEMAFINGRKIDLNNKQTELSKKFLKKYGLN